MLCVHAYAMIEEGVSMEHANVDEVFWSIYIIFEILPFDPWFYLEQITLVLILYRAVLRWENTTVLEIVL